MHVFVCVCVCVCACVCVYVCVCAFVTPGALIISPISVGDGGRGS